MRVIFVCYPQGADNFVNAQRCVAAGADITLWLGEVHPDALRWSVRSVLDDPSYRLAARRLEVQIAEMPGPDDVVADIVELFRPR
jgi:UDP:flavonoid glycosyltransferase YjiC (YdhE family)